jgi:hypothetical protein
VFNGGEISWQATERGCEQGPCERMPCGEGSDGDDGETRNGVTCVCLLRDASGDGSGLPKFPRVQVRARRLSSVCVWGTSSCRPPWKMHSLHG